MIRSCIACGLVVVVVALGVAAQPRAGDLVVASADVGHSNGSLVRAISPSGVVRVLFRVPYLRVASVTMDRNNRDLLVAASDAIGGAILDRVSPSGVVTTVARLPGRWPTDVMVDEDGTYLMPYSQYRVPFTLVRVTATGVVTSMVPRPGLPGGWGRSICGEIVSGQIAVVDYGLYRVTRRGVAHVLTSIVPAATAAAVISDPRTGKLIVSRPDAILRVDPFRATATTLVRAGTGMAFGDIVSEQNQASWAVTYSGLTHGLLRVDRSGGITTILGRTAGAIFAQGITRYGSRNVAATGVPQVGSVFTVDLSEPGSANLPYFAAASSATTPGIPTPIGTVDLRPDPLMALSLTTPAIFRGFAGRLSATGAATATIAIPNVAALRNARFFVSFVTVGSGGLKSIANTAGFTIQ